MRRFALLSVCLLRVSLACGDALPLGDPVSETIREHVDRLRYADDRDVQGSPVILREPVARLYEARQFRSAWSDPIRLNELIATLGDVESDGLDPRDYHVGQLSALRDRMRAANRFTLSEQADLDLLATDALALAMYHLYTGKVDPVRISSQWNFDQRPLRREDAITFLNDVLDTGRIREALAAARPSHPWYERGRERLREYRRIATDGGWPTVPPGPTLKPGMTDARVAVLRERLRVTRDLAPGDIASAPSASSLPPVAPAGAPTTRDGATALADFYGPDLETAVRHFQARHGLETDGAVGPATLAALNVPVGARIDQIRINLERARWVLHEIKGEFVLVDVAGFDVSYFRDDEPVWTSRVVVGRPYRETPIFRSEITYVVFNPTWTIPPTILANDTLPAIKRDPGYLARNRIRVVDARGREVPPGSVDWHRYSRSIPYQLRQDPGPDNALGLVKIMFPNRYSVYLHDSPAKALFERESRAFSSGCIRVQKAFELTELLLNDPQRWNAAAIQEVVDTGQTQTVNLQRPVPVLILYWTAQPTAAGDVIFRNDVYGRDPPLLEALDSDFKLPPPLPAG